MQNSKHIHSETALELHDKTPISGISNEKIFDYFFRKYYPALCFFAQSIIHNEEEAKDIVQDCYYKLWASKSIGKRTYSIKSFLYTMVRNSCITYLRRKIVLTKAISYIKNKQNTTDYFDETAFAELARIILTRIDELPPKMKSVLKKYYLEGKRLKKIASELSTTENAVQIYKQKAIKLLRQYCLDIRIYE